MLMLSWLANLGDELITDCRQFLIFSSLELFGLILRSINSIEIITFWSTDRSKDAILISDFLSSAVSLAISAALDLWSSDILELALQQSYHKLRQY